MTRLLQSDRAGQRRPVPAIAAFTLVELLVSMVLLLILMGMTSSMISATQSVWSKSTSQSDQLRSARHAFEIVSRRVSQSTLNSYWYIPPPPGNMRYERASELRFLSGTASTLVPGAAPGGSAIFFQSPTGFYSDGSGDLESALNTWGYFVEYGSDAKYRPAFLKDTGVPERYRYRLIEFLDPCDQLAVFGYSSGNQTYEGYEWFTDPLKVKDEQGRDKNKRVLADNVIAFVILPKLSSLEDATGFALAPKMTYNSTDRVSDARLNPRNQLPPVVEIAAIVLDEQSAAKIKWGSSPPDFGVDRSSMFLLAERMEDDLQRLQSALRQKGLDCQILRMTVPIVASRWSTEQTE